MSEMAMTSTGHALGDASWLDAHFESARAEYEDAVRFVGILPGWTVLDAGCGSGGYVPLIVRTRRGHRSGRSARSGAGERRSRGAAGSGGALCGPRRPSSRQRAGPALRRRNL